MKNPILDELHAVREKMLADAGGTIEGLVAKIQADQMASGRTIRKSRRTIRCTEAAKSSDLPVESQPSPLGDGNRSCD